MKRKIVLTVQQPHDMPYHVNRRYFREVVNDTFAEEARDITETFFKILGPSTMLRLEDGFGIYPHDIAAVMHRMAIKVIFIDTSGNVLKVNRGASGVI